MLGPLVPNFFFPHMLSPRDGVKACFLFLQTRRSSSSSSRGSGSGSTSSPNGRGSCSSSSKRKLSNCVGTSNGSSNSATAPDNGYEVDAASNCKIGRQRSSASMEGTFTWQSMRGFKCTGSVNTCCRSDNSFCRVMNTFRMISLQALQLQRYTDLELICAYSNLCIQLAYGYAYHFPISIIQFSSVLLHTTCVLCSELC